MVKRINKKNLLLVLLTTIILSLTLNFYISNSSTEDKIVDNYESVITETNIIEENNIVDELRNNYNNNDVVGVIKIDDTDINEPVLKGEDNNYYLTHTITKEYDKYGSIYMDYRTDLNNSKKILIFGHNSSYYTKEKVPFKELENYYEENYYKNHKYITLILDKEIRTYEIFSIYVETSDFTYMNMKFENQETWYNHLLNLKNKSLYNTNIDITEDDEILILQTCSTNKNYSNYEKKYLLIISKKI